MYIPEKVLEKEIYNNGKKKVLLRIFKNRDWSTKEVPIYGHSLWSYSTMALILDKKGDLYYWKEFRDWTEWIVYNFSAWKHEEEYSFEENMKKELNEEFWITDSKLSYIWETIIWAYDTGFIKYYVATNCIFWEQELEPWEEIEIKKCSPHEFEEKIASGFINCPHTISCYTLAKLKNHL